MEMSQNPQVVEPRNSSGDGPDEDPPRRSENKRKRFHPFRAVRNIFSRKAKRQGSDEVQGTSKKSRSTSELSRVSVDVPQFPGLAPPYAVGLSVSHDSIFTPDNGQDDLQGSSLSIQHAGFKGFQDELFTRVRARRDSDDDDVGLPHSPCTSPTTADVLAQGLKDKSSKSRSTCSASSLLSMGSSENDEDLMGQSPSSRFSYMDRSDFDSDLDAAQPVPLNHNAALHKIAVRPKRTHGLPHHRKLQQMAASAARLTLPATPEVTEDPGKLLAAASSLSAPPDQEEITNVEKESTEEVDLQVDVPSVFAEPKEEEKVTTPVMETLKVSEIPSIEDDLSSLPVEREIHISKGKSAAAELKLRHEIKEFSKRQNEKRDIAAMDVAPQSDDNNLMEVVDVLESIKSLESTVSVEENKSDVEELEAVENVQDQKQENTESWCVIELEENREQLVAVPDVDVENSKVCNDIESTDDQVQRTVININEVTVTNDSTFIKRQSVGDEITFTESEKIDQIENFVNKTDQEKHSRLTDNVEDTTVNDVQKIQAVQKDIPPSQLNFNEVTEKHLSMPLVNNQQSGVAECKTDQNILPEKSHVVLRRHTSNRAVSQSSNGQKDFRASADMTSSPNFSDIMRHRRSLVDNEATPEGMKSFVRSVSEENSKNSPLTSRVSVEIIPFNQRNKNPNYLSSSPSKTSGDDREEMVENSPPAPESSSSLIGDASSKPDRMQYPIRFRIRKGSRSFSEVKETATSRGDEIENRYSDPKPHLRPKPQLPLKDETVSNKATPEFLRIQLRSSKEELDKLEHLPATASPQATPQWEVKILQRQRSGPSSLPYMAATQAAETKKASESKIAEINGNIEKPQLEKQNSDPKSLPTSVSLEKKTSDPKSQATTASVDSVNNEPELNKTDEVKTKANNNLPAERTATPTSVASNDSATKVPSSPKSTNSHEPELFRVFARRSIKQKHSDKSTETKATNSEKTDSAEKSAQVESIPKTTESSGLQTPKAPQSQQKMEPKVMETPKKQEVQKVEMKITETPKKHDVKISIGEMPRKLEMTPKGISNEPIRKQDTVETKSNLEEPVRKIEPATKVIPNTKKVDNAVEERIHNTPIWSRNINAKSWINPEARQTPVETLVHRRNSAPVEPKTAEKENMHAREPTQVTVNIQSQRPTIPLTRNDSSSKIMINNNKDMNMGGGNTPSWMQLAQQRREQREQKERMLYASTGSSTFVLEPNSRPSRNSKVLDMVNNFQKLQTT